MNHLLQAKCSSRASASNLKNTIPINWYIDGAGTPISHSAPILFLVPLHPIPPQRPPRTSRWVWLVVLSLSLSLTAFQPGPLWSHCTIDLSLNRWAPSPFQNIAVAVRRFTNMLPKFVQLTHVPCPSIKSKVASSMSSSDAQPSVPLYYFLQHA